MSQQPTPPDAPTGAPQTVHPPAAPAKNTVGRVAIILAAVGFVFACIPGALIVGWVLLPAAFILGIVGVTRAGQRKGTSIAAIVISVVGTVVGVVVFVSVAATAVSDAFEEAGGGEITAIPDDAPAGEGTDDAAGDAEDDAAGDAAAEDAAAAGTRANPFAFGDTVKNEDWTVTLTAFDADADAEVAEANQFNDEPTPGTRWVTVDVSATYTGEDAGNVLGVSIDYVTADGAVVSSFDHIASGLEPEWDSLAELYTGASEAGRLAFLVPDTVDGLVRVQLGLFADEVFLALPAS